MKFSHVLISSKMSSFQTCLPKTELSNCISKILSRVANRMQSHIKNNQLSKPITICLWEPSLYRISVTKSTQCHHCAPLCTYRLNWARISSWGWLDEWDDTAIQIQDSEIPALAVWGRARNAPSRSPESGPNPRSLTFHAGRTAPGPPSTIIL